MNKDMKISVEHLTRVEGHGNIEVDLQNGELKKCILDIVEAPRFFEAMVRGKNYFEVPHITSRICGICSIGHTFASINAVEDAFGFKPDETILLLRKLLLHGENLQSHTLHVYFLAAPDFLGAPSVMPLIKSNPDVVKRALRMKWLANYICDVVGGRTVHPITTRPGGFTKIPTKKELLDLREKLVEGLDDLSQTLDLFATLKIPNFERETEFISLKGVDEYPFYDGDMKSSLNYDTPKHDYKKVTNEFIVPHSTAKHCKAKTDAIMVGALARVNNNFDLLNNEAKEAASKFNFKPISYNPYMNNVAQVIEIVHSHYDSIQMIDKLLDMDLGHARWEITPKAGEGVGAVEVPRGILYHHYKFNSDGILEKANCIIPTNQNLENIDLDMKKLVPEILDKSKEEITLMLEMLVRAYDPCISCSTHLLDVKFV